MIRRTGVTVSKTTEPLPPTSPPGGGTLEVTLTSPASGATVSGAVTVNVWVAGASGARAFTLEVDGQAPGTKTVSGNHTWFSWNSAAVADGPHTLCATVTDGTGQTGWRSIGVTSRN
jgi:hypothetical protein